MRKFGLIGYPLSHSFSPAYFAQKFRREEIADCFYDPYPIPAIHHLQDLLEQQPYLQGLNVTIPYKKSVIPFLSFKSEAVSKIEACNCIKIKNGVLEGYNTDVTGFKKSLLPLLSDKHKMALILGTGGSAAAVKFVLEELGITFLSVSRNKEDQPRLISYNEVTQDLLANYTLVINTTPVGMYPSVENCPDIPYKYLTSDHYLFDLIYNPAQTLFLRKGAEHGALIKNGSDMLVIQAEESWQIWNDD